MMKVMDGIKRAVVYVRVSTAQQVDGASLDNQEERCNEWALRNGVLVMRTFREEGASAKTANRPQLQEMLEFLRDKGHSINYLLIYDVDRLARNVPDFVAIYNELSLNKIELKDPSNSVEGNKSDKLIRYIKAIAAEIDNDVKSERVIDNMKKHGAYGYRMSKAPYGLTNKRDILGHSIITPAPDLADKIAHVLTEFSKGYLSIKELLSIANDIGLMRPNGHAVNHAFIGKLLRKPIYAGYEQSDHTGGQLVEASQFDGIVSKDIYWRNQRILERRKGNKAESYQINHPDFALRRFIICASCKSPVRGSAPTGGSGKRYPKYHCTHCKRSSITAAELDSQFVDLLQNVTPGKLSLGLMKVMIVRVWNDELKGLHQQRKKLQTRIDELEEHKQRATDKVVSDDITKLEKVEIHQRADAEISGLKSAIEKLAMQMGTQQGAIDYVLSYMGNAPRLWSDATADMKVVYQNMIFPEGIEYDFAKKTFGTPKLSALYTLANIKKDLSNDDKSLLVIPRRVELLLPG